MHKNYLKGLNSLRFFAAFFVIIAHAQISIWKMGFDKFKDVTFFNRHGDAVEFFFVLSGFLITYLLHQEIIKTGTISIRKFYLRRVFRIWPLYFLVIAVGFVFLGLLYPAMTGQRFFEFPLLTGLAMYICFLPNLAVSLYPTGLLYPLWSIGVEEQYYLFWAPLVKFFRKRLTLLILSFVAITYVWYFLLVNGYIFPSGKLLYFLKTQKFYAMATGGLFGLIMFKYPQQYQKSFFASKFAQWTVYVLIGYYYLVGPFTYLGDAGSRFFLSGLYGLLILNTALLEKTVINLEKKPLVYLGTISYGLYMCHMMADYVLRFTAMHFHLEKRLGFAVLMPLYHISVWAGAILLASLSYRYYESYFLRLKEKYA